MAQALSGSARYDALASGRDFEARRAPSFNFNQEQSLQSIDKVAALLKAERGQLWINHDSAQNATVPHAPQYVQ